MSVTHVIGVDPGLVDVGVVRLEFDTKDETLIIRPTVVAGSDVPAIAALCTTGLATVYVEQYRPRQRLDTDVRMVQLEQDLRRALPKATFISNMGIKKIVSQELMEALELWNFKQVTHHQDLRSAARIALLGMMKTDHTNRLIADVVKAHLDGARWTFAHV